jgi:DNA-binding MarR family transcriptional regulator
MVQRAPDARDARARRIVFTPAGLAWLQAYQAAVDQAQRELAQAVGDEVATVVALGLEAYCGH